MAGRGECGFLAEAGGATPPMKFRHNNKNDTKIRPRSLLQQFRWHHAGGSCAPRDRVIGDLVLPGPVGGHLLSDFTLRFPAKGAGDLRAPLAHAHARGITNGRSVSVRF